MSLNAHVMLRQAAVSEPRAIAARASAQLEMLKEQLREVETYGEPAAARKLSVLRSEIAPQEALHLKATVEVNPFEIAQLGLPFFASF